ncbi:MFS transporter [Alkalibacter mobilis]|uniref:MFS transporter n=1 Tax=Alkalibacter mobilis TaxID=2787712 RepID=UPI0018A0C5C3|nr:MFS transporter [Alkalibacter mobilis]MBF7095642.1 MFS transporter [Alkalibacter mobilis]
MKKFNGHMKLTDISKMHKFFLIVLISMGSSIIYLPIYLKNVFYEPLLLGLGINNEQLGALVGMYGIMATILYIPSGIVADKIRVRTLASVGFVSTALAVFWYASMPSYGVLLFIFGLLAVTTILIWWGTRFKLVRLVSSEAEYPKNIGFSYGLYGIGGLLFNMVALGVFNSIADQTQGVKVVLTFMGAIILLLGILSYLFIPKFEGEINTESKSLNLSEFAEAIKHPGVWLTSISMFFVMFVYMGMNYTTPYFTAVYGAPLALVSIIGMIRTYGITLISSPVLGKIAEKINSPAKVIMAVSLVAGICYSVFIFAPKAVGFTFVIAVTMIVLGFVGNGAFGITSSQLTQTHVPVHIFGAATGIVSVVGFLPESFMHQWFGYLMDSQGDRGFDTIFKILFACAILSILSSLMVKRYAQSQAKAKEIDKNTKEVVA